MNENLRPALDTALNRINDARLILEGIECIAGSYMDGGLYNGSVCNTEDIFGLAILAKKSLDEATDACTIVPAEASHG